MINEVNQSRREFISNLTKSFGVCTCAMIAGGVLSSCEKFTELASPSQGITKTVNITDEKLFPLSLHRNYLQGIGGFGGGARLSFDDANYGIQVILVRLNEDEMACYSTLCTHDNCYNEQMPICRPDYKFLKCSCHNSVFDPAQNGKAIVGPAEKPLKKFKTTFNKETNIVTIEF